jgi:hypothetical protein
VYYAYITEFGDSEPSESKPSSEAPGFFHPQHPQPCPGFTGAEDVGRDPEDGGRYAQPAPPPPSPLSFSSLISGGLNRPLVWQVALAPGTGLLHGIPLRRVLGLGAASVLARVSYP